MSAKNVWAVGSYYPYPRPGSYESTLVLHWNGKKWRQMGSTNPGGANLLSDVVAVGRNNVWAVGTTYGSKPPLVERWNGHSSRTVAAASGFPHCYLQGFTALAPLAGNDIWAVGRGGPLPGCDNGLDDSPTQALAEHWDGNVWSVSLILDPPSSFVDIAVATPHAIWAVG